VALRPQPALARYSEHPTPCGVAIAAVFPNPGGLLTNSRPTCFPPSPLSCRKKNPSTISRSRPPPP